MGNARRAFQLSVQLIWFNDLYFPRSNNDNIVIDCDAFLFLQNTIPQFTEILISLVGETRKKKTISPNYLYTYRSICLDTARELLFQLSQLWPSNWCSLILDWKLTHHRHSKWKTSNEWMNGITSASTWLLRVLTLMSRSSFAKCTSNNRLYTYVIQFHASNFIHTAAATRC